MFRTNENLHEARRISKRSRKFHVQRFHKDRGVKHFKDFDSDRFYKRRVSSIHGVSKYDSAVHCLESAVDEECDLVKGHYPD